MIFITKNHDLNQKSDLIKKIYFFNLRKNHDHYQPYCRVVCFIDLNQ